MKQTPDPGRGSSTPPEGRSPDSSLILRSATLYLLPLLLLLSVFLLLRGHDEPGGGFTGGLVASAAFVLYAVAHGTSSARRSLPWDPVLLTALGLLLAGGSGVVASLTGRALFTSLWSGLTLPVLGEIGTPLLFDAGVYLTVIGAVLLIFFSLMEDE